VQVDVNRGFAKSKRPSLDILLDRWRAFRAGALAPPVAVDELAEAILAKELARLGALIGRRDAAKVRVDVSKLPLDLPRLPGQPTIPAGDLSLRCRPMRSPPRAPARARRRRLRLSSSHFTEARKRRGR
jgi:hypothetical protein